MPADRRITVHVEQLGRRADQSDVDAGLASEVADYIPGPSLDLPVWATRDDQSLEDVEFQGGVYATVTRRWRIRWDSRVYDSVLAQMTITEGGRVFNALSITEVTDQGATRPRSRRRWIDLTGVFTT